MTEVSSIHPWLLCWLKAESSGSGECSAPKTPEAWPAILDDSRCHGLVPLLCRAIESRSDWKVPTETATELRRATAGIAAKNLLLADELRQVLLAAQKGGLDCIPLRGVALGSQLYGSVAARPTGDIDLFVRRNQLGEIRELFSELGYCEAEARSGFALEFYYALELFKERHGTVIAEPRWTLAYPPHTDRLTLESVRPRCTKTEIVGVPAVSLSCEDLIVHLCLHLLHHHRGAPFLWIYELDRLMRSADVNWSVLISVVQQARLQALVAASIRRVRAHLETPIPGGVLSELGTGLPLSERKLVNLLTTTSPLKGREKLATLIQPGPLGRKVRYVVSFVLPSPSFIRTQYGLSGWWQVALTYVWRIGYLTWHAVSGIARLIRDRR